VTGQPDFGRLDFEYAPDQFIAETKSLKLWLRKWREKGSFNEVIVEALADEFYEAVKPKWVTIIGRFNHRGGIAVTATTTRGAKG
jgi:7-cyano-7-deazaguanine reductase